MDKKHIERIIENKYSLLLFFLIVFACVSIVTSKHGLLHFSAISVLSLVVFAIMLKILKASRLLFRLFVTLAFLALFSHFIAVFVRPSKALGIVAMTVYIVMIAIIIIFMIKRIFSERLVTGDTIKGGVSVYLLFAIWWQLVYYFIWMLDPKAFVFSQGPPLNLSDFLYYSVIIMTSVGIGDIAPVSSSAKVFSMFQAIVGQLYTAVFVARLVGLHIVHSNRKE